MCRLLRCCCVAIVMGTSADGYSADNLLPNGSFEQGGPDVARLPAGWEIEKGPRKCFQLTSDRPFDGGLCLELTIADEADTEPVAGFNAVSPNRSFDHAGDYGWQLRPGQVLSRGQLASQPGYPTRLQSHAVRRATFSCALPDGPYVASIHMGALWRTDIEMMNHLVEVKRESVVNDVRDRDRLMDEEYSRYVQRMIGSWFWEELREGVDDDAYLTTLENWIDRAKSRPEPAVIAARRKAEAALAEIADRIDLDIERTIGGRGLSLYRPFAPEVFDALRSKAARAITELKAAIDEAKQHANDGAGDSLGKGLQLQPV